MTRAATWEEVETRLELALDGAADPAAVVAEYAARYPHLAGLIRGHVADEDLIRAAFAPPPPPLAPGDRVGEFTVRGPVADGGMGQVYRAWDDALGREVAVKLPPGGDAGGSSAARRFLAEARVTARLQHPGIPPVYRTGTLPDGRPFLAMKLIDGRTLAELLRDAPPVDHLAVFEAVCQAVAYAHSRGVLHRDLKPSNVMVGAFGEVQVMDWGLAKAVGSERWAVGGENHEPEPDPSSTPHSEFRIPQSDATQAGSVIGTPAFMPPEQAAGELDKVGPRSDVFGLGAILCALLTGRPPFGGADPEEQQRNAAAGRTGEALARLDGCGADPDVVALCKRCLAFDPADRPASADAVAGAVAALRRAADERARQAERDKLAAEVRRRATRRAAVAVAAVLVLGLVGTTIGLVRADRARRDREVAGLLLESAGLRLAAGRTDGWSKRAWGKVEEAARKRPGPDVRDEAAATLVGLDAELVKRWDEPKQAEKGWNGVAFSPSGRRVVAGGTGGRPTWVWDRGAADHREIAVPGGGPVGFRGETAVQVFLPTPERPSIVVWDLDADRPIQTFAADPLPPGEWVSAALTPGAGADSVRVAGAESSTPRWLGLHLPPGGGGRRGFASRVGGLTSAPPGAPQPAAPLRSAATSPARGEVEDPGAPKTLPRPPQPLGYLAAAFKPASGTGFVAVWDLSSGRLVRRIDGPAAGVALSADGKLLAVGGEAGEVTVWPLPAGEPLPAVRVGRTPVRAVALGPGLVGGPAWRLAAGDDGGMVCTWDEARPESVTRHPGSYHEVLAVVFSPDGMTLASAGRHRARLWDAATGRLLLEYAPPRSDAWRDVSTGLTFAPNGASLAVASVTTANKGVGGADVWRLDNGRGVRTLGGLTSRVEWVWPSRDWTRLAAMSHDWRVAVWDLPTGRLLARFDMTPGLSADHAGLAFSRDGRRLAFSAGTEAGEWDLQTGRRLRRWVFPKGLHDQLAYHPDGGLFLFRKEYDGDPDADGTPQLGVLRHLRPGGWLGPAFSPTRLVFQTDAYRARLRGVRVSSDSRYFVVYGDQATKGPFLAAAYDAATGRVLWSGELPSQNAVAVPDPAGGGLFVPRETDGHFRVIDLPGGREVGEVRRPATADPGPGGRLSLGYRLEPRPTVSVFRQDELEPFISLPLGVPVTSRNTLFTPDARHLVWGGRNGSVLVWDIPASGRRLAGLGLGW
jgi:WD40 repeat protein